VSNQTNNPNNANQAGGPGSSAAKPEAKRDRTAYAPGPHGLGTPIPAPIVKPSDAEITAAAGATGAGSLSAGSRFRAAP